jgi:hypothetical protein
MRASINLAICLSILLGVAQIGARAETVQAWSRQFNVAYITGMATFQAKLQANPSADKGLIIAVPVKFDRMVAENVAIFRGGVLPGIGDNSPTAQIVILNLPSVQFVAGDTLVLAFKILGMHPQYGLPHGEFVGAYRCTRPDCHDFLG